MGSTTRTVSGSGAVRSAKNCAAWGSKGSWTGFNIAAMVLGFVFFWPVGLVLLYWIIRGRDVRDIPNAARDLWGDLRGHTYRSGSDNILFEEYQQTQYDRIHEIEEEIKARRHRFSEFREDVKRRADQEEFNQFMASGPSASAQ